MVTPCGTPRKARVFSPPEYPVTGPDRTAAVRRPDHPAERTEMATFKALSRGSQIVLVAGPLLFGSLFFTWQHVEVDYGRAGVATIALDGWDAWGLLLALLVLATIVLVALRSFTEGELSDDVPWPTITLGLGGAIFAVALVK